LAQAFGLRPPDPMQVKFAATERLQLWRQFGTDVPDELLARFERMAATGRVVNRLTD
jgi:hypothetical protein